jgi:glycosyltransferase involved in cell wall biosynthesis
MSQVYRDVSIVVVTYKRIELLKILFKSIAANTIRPGCVYVVDNDNDQQVGDLCAEYARVLEDSRMVWIPMEENSGGSGGFSKGVETAYAEGAEWIWIMDDDVKLLPDALERLKPWMNEALEKNRRVIQCQRLNFDGASFYWQYRFLYRLGVPNPIAPSGFKPGESYRLMNTACFEGGLFHRSVAEAIGAPDPRFFIYWDDTIYGYLASKITQPILIKDVLMQRQRFIDSMKIGRVRRLNATSDMVRYYIMRNRAYMAKYIQSKGEYNAFLWGLGTALTLMKELLRLFVTREFRSGFSLLRKGMRDARREMKNADWRPMPPLGNSDD